MDLRKWAIFSLLEPHFVSKIKIACVFGNSGNEALIVTDDDNVYALGSNSAGCLGLECHDSTLLPKKVKALCQKHVKGFTYGSGPHVLAYTEDGLVFSWGHNGYCEVGDGTSCQRLKPAVVEMALEGKRVIAVAAGSHHSLILTYDGEVYAWGQNNCGQVGSALGSNQSAPRKVNSVIGAKKCVSIACGQTSSIAVTENGEVYAWGYNGVGQLGVGNTTNQPTPMRVKGILCSVVITKVECGYSHTLALSDMGQLFAWGSNGYGQLGTGTKSNCNSPTQIAQDIGRFGANPGVAANTMPGHRGFTVAAGWAHPHGGQPRGCTVAFQRWTSHSSFPWGHPPDQEEVHPPLARFAHSMDPGARPPLGFQQAFPMGGLKVNAGEGMDQRLHSQPSIPSMEPVFTLHPHYHDCSHQYMLIVRRFGGEECCVTY